MILVDTAVWFALLVQKDSQHLEVARWFDELSERILTTDYTSHTVAADMGVKTIASFDGHFLVTGNFEVVP